MSCTKILEAVPIVITCTGATAHYPNGCALLKAYDHNNDGVLDTIDTAKAIADYNAGLITVEESVFVTRSFAFTPNHLINEACPGCFISAPLPIVTFNSHRFETPIANSTSRILINVTVSNAPSGTNLNVSIDGVPYLLTGVQNGTWEIVVGNTYPTSVQHNVTVQEANAC